jgi:hypothetical protein
MVTQPQHEIYFILVMMTFGLAIPIWVIRPLWERRSDILIKIGLFSFIFGLILGGLAPVYLKFSNDVRFFFLLMGAAIFFSFGLANILTYYWGDAGYAVSLAIFSWFIHSIVVTKMGPDPVATKTFVVFCLVIAAAFFVNSIDFTKKKEKVKPKKGKIVVAVLGGIITAVKFTVIIIDMLR